MAPRAAVLIAALALGGCVKAQSTARQQAGCGSCHELHYLREGACHECHRGNPAAQRMELAHERLLSGRASEHRLVGGPALREGRRLVEALACRRCHSIGGQGNRLATDLDRVVWTREQAQLVSSIREPVENMPSFGLDQRQAEALVAFLLRSGGRDKSEDGYRVHFTRGASVSPTAFEKSCGGCHRSLGGSGPVGSGSAGPNLSGLFTPFYPPTAPGNRAWTEKALADWLRNPRASRHTTTMPPVELSGDELRLITAELGAAGVWPRAGDATDPRATMPRMADVTRSLDLPYEPLESAPDDATLWAEVPLELLVRYGCVPVRREGERIVLAFGSLDDETKLDEIEFQLERPVEAVLAPAERVAAALRRHRGGEMLLEQASEGLRLQLVADDETAAIEEKLLPAESPIVRLVDSLVLGAIDRRASDIHIETKEREVIVKYRIDGVLHPALEPLDKKHHQTIVSRLKVMSELDIAEKRVPQDGRFRLRVKGRTIDFRVSIMPSMHGEDAVIRILDKEQLHAAFRDLRLDVLGFSEPDLRKLRKYITEPYGMVLVTGPTGSGKTTTLYAAISEIVSPEDKIITIEDPVEYQIPGIVQVPVNEKKGLTFARGLRSILRHDPDKIMVGEVRDPETAQIAVQSALTGHLVFTTVHANNVFDVLGRFLHMGVEPYNFVSALNCVMAQRLVRLLCQACRRPAAITPTLLHESGLDPELYHDQVFYEGKGCDECGGTGFLGRTAVAELLDMSDRIRQLVLERRPAAEIKQAAREEGMTLLRDSALEKVFAGLTTLREINKVTFVH